MILSLQHEDDPAHNGSMAMESTEYAFFPTKDEQLLEYKEARHSQFNEEQIKASIAYLSYQFQRYGWRETKKAVTYWEERLEQLEG
ncbi:MAG: hypothetical protein AAGI23_08900 [Bacteroidota bacterium]